MKHSFLNSVSTKTQTKSYDETVQLPGREML